MQDVQAQMITKQLIDVANAVRELDRRLELVARTLVRIADAQEKIAKAGSPQESGNQQG